jgi:hypothetical protein
VSTDHDKTREELARYGARLDEHDRRLAENDRFHARAIVAALGVGMASVTYVVGVVLARVGGPVP